MNSVDRKPNVIYLENGNPKHAAHSQTSIETTWNNMLTPMQSLYQGIEHLKIKLVTIYM